MAGVGRKTKSFFRTKFNLQYLFCLKNPNYRKYLKKLKIISSVSQLEFKVGKEEPVNHVCKARWQFLGLQSGELGKNSPDFPKIKYSKTENSIN